MWLATFGEDRWWSEIKWEIYTFHDKWKYGEKFELEILTVLLYEEQQLLYIF